MDLARDHLGSWEDRGTPDPVDDPPAPRGPRWQACPPGFESEATELAWRTVPLMHGDDAALDVMKLVVGGRLNIDLCAALLRAGALDVIPSDFTPDDLTKRLKRAQRRARRNNAR